MAKGKKKWLETGQFFTEVSKRANYMDHETIKAVYYSLIKTIVSECRISGGIKLPDFGDFSMTMQKGKGLVDVNTREYRTIPPRRSIKFSLDYKLKAYLKQLDDSIFKKS